MAPKLRRALDLLLAHIGRRPCACGKRKRSGAMVPVGLPVIRQNCFFDKPGETVACQLRCPVCDHVAKGALALAEGFDEQHPNQ